jgi:AraC family transcriptional regulator
MNMFKLFSSSQKINHLPKEENYCVFSVLQEFNHSVQSNHIGIKYVSTGLEKYSINNQSYNVTGGSYLLVNNLSSGKVEVDSDTDVKGFCINLKPKLISETVASLIRPDTYEADIILDTFFTPSNQIDRLYKCSETVVGKTLKSVGELIDRNLFSDILIEEDFYCTLAEKLALDQLEIFKKIKFVNSVKSETKKILYKKTMLAKEFIDEHFNTEIDVASLAKIAGMSEYHFFRIFKAVHSLSPHQYVIKKRMEFSYKLLVKGNGNVSSVALDSGFADIYSFSKAFKKYFEINPSALIIG